MMNKLLENRLPPPLVLVLCMLLVWMGRRIWGDGGGVDSGNVWDTGLWGVPYILFGLAVISLGMMQFFAAKTTINPLDPELASSLVSQGVFSYTRNPMYLGMALVLLGQIIALGWPLGFFMLIFFVAYIQFFQIAPEEKAMHKLFGNDYNNYCKEVRRWI